ncbi:transposase [Maridesulfovibrio hydrothermalis]|uniref:transposase n=1 Tax=Maridesulfovibrio hydrothermalis TaxID=191026 RepID=UPI000AF8DF16|nr:transposase [Maridesulfovibrio hydrothermalis]
MKIGKKRRKFSDKFKAKIALEAVRGVKTLTELAAEHQVHPNQISKWKKQLLENASELFSNGSGSSVKSEDEVTAPLYEEIGRLKMDIKWLEKKALSLPAVKRRNWIRPERNYSIRRQCRLASVSRSVIYYKPVPESGENLRFMRLIDEQYLRHPEFGSP